MSAWDSRTSQLSPSKITQHSAYMVLWYWSREPIFRNQHTLLKSHGTLGMSSNSPKENRNACERALAILLPLKGTRTFFPIISTSRSVQKSMEELFPKWAVSDVFLKQKGWLCMACAPCEWKLWAHRVQSEPTEAEETASGRKKKTTAQN